MRRGPWCGRPWPDHEVSADGVEVSAAHTTAELHVLSQPSDGERSIFMASGSTSCIDAPTMARLWARLYAEVCLAAMLLPAVGASPPTRWWWWGVVVVCGVCGGGCLFAQVSQVPLRGVRALLELGNAARAVTVLDVGVSPRVCVDEARLGSLDDLKAVVQLAKVQPQLSCSSRPPLSFFLSLFSLCHFFASLSFFF